MTALRFAHHESHFRAFSPVLALLLLCLCGGPVLAEPLELGTAQLIERGRWGDIGCFGRTLDIEDGVAVVGDSCDHMTSGAAYAFAVQPGGLWEQTWEYAKGSGNEDDHFGADCIHRRRPGRHWRGCHHGQHLFLSGPSRRRPGFHEQIFLSGHGVRRSLRGPCSPGRPDPAERFHGSPADLYSGRTGRRVDRGQPDRRKPDIRPRWRHLSCRSSERRCCR